MKTEFVIGDENDILVNSGLLQFPYGIGGLNESRVQMNGTKCKHVDLQEYLTHLSLLSQMEFHRPLFQLILYSLISKERY